MSAPAGSLPRAPAQVCAVLELRLSALRGRDRLRAALGLGTFCGVVCSAPAVGAMLPRDRVADFAGLTPSAWLLFAVGAAVGAGTGAGGRQLLPRDQAVAFPLSPAADQLGALLLAPLNLAWLAQAVGLLALAAWQVGPGSTLPAALVLTAAWIVAATTMAQAVGWAVELLRTSRAGLLALRAGLLTLLSAVVAVGSTGRWTAVLGRLPTAGVAGATLRPSSVGAAGWCAHALGLALVTVVSWLVGVRLVHALQRRPQPRQGRAESRSHPRRAVPRSPLLASLWIDLAGVARSAPLRRGVLALLLIGIGGVAVSGLPWRTVVLLPGLVASGAGLLFGVNAFALDGHGAVWRESLPADPRTYLWARLATVTVVCSAAATGVVAAGAVRAPGPPTTVEAVAVIGAVLATTMHVVTRCATWSVRRPYAAGLRRPRDQPAPPGAMAGYAARLSASTTMLGIVLMWLVEIGSVTATVSITAAWLLVGLRRLLMVSRLWLDPAVRERVLATVSGG